MLQQIMKFIFAIANITIIFFSSGILSKYTAFVAVHENQESVTNTMQSIDINRYN